MNATPTNQPLSPEDHATTVKLLTKKMQDIFQKGTPLYAARGLSKKHMEMLYITAFNLYSEAKYKEAFSIFQSITFYNYTDQRAWMGAAGCCEMLKDYEYAIAGYSYAALLDGTDPLPALHAFDCHVALKNYPQALSALDSVILRSSKKPEYEGIKIRAEALRDALHTTLNESKKQ